MLLRITDLTKDGGVLLSKRTSRNGSLWLISVYMVNLMLECLPFMYWKISKASFSLLNRQKVSSTSRTHYYKLAFVGPFSSNAQNIIKRLTERFCKNLDIKLVFAPWPYKIKNLCSAKDASPKLPLSQPISCYTYTFVNI